jgi:hypothetical protein
MGREDGTGSQLEKLRGRIRSWRLSQPKSRRMPEPLWQEAGTLAASLGVSHVAAELGLGFTPLKLRASAVSTAPKSAAPVRFLEVSGAQLLSERSAAMGPVVEFADSDGARVTITLPIGSQLDVAALVAALRRRS